MWVLLLAALVAATTASPLVLVDSVKGDYVQAGPKALLAAESNAALVAAVTGWAPGHGQEISAELSKELGLLLKPSPLVKPRAFVALNVAGLSAVALRMLFPHREHRSIELTGDGCPAMAVVNGLTQISSWNPSVKLTVVDHSGVQNCKEACLDMNLASAATDAHVDIQALDLSQPEDKLLAVEIASIYAGVKGYLAAAKQRADLGLQQQDGPELLEVSLMGLHALADKYGKGSAKLSGATNAVIRLLKWAVDSLDTVYGGDVVYEVLILEDGPARAETLTKLIGWKDMTRRVLLQAPFPAADETAQARQFSAKAAGYGSFILLLYFSLAAVWCMCNMPFKQDTLLYGSKKEQ